MADEVETSHSLDDVPEPLLQELVRRMATADRDDNREVYDALEDE